MPKRYPVKKAKAAFYFTDILDPYNSGTMEEIKSTNITSEVTSKVLKVYDISGTYILKTLSCPKEDTESLNQARAEFEIARTLSKESPNIVSTIDFKEWEDPADNIVHIEMLLEYGGENLETVAKKLNVTEILNVIRSTLGPFSLMERFGVFHSDIKPANMVVKDGLIKIIDFGISKDLKEKTLLGTPFSTISTKMVGGTPGYIAPEVIRQSGNYILGKIDVYAWGMTIYQLITGKTNEEICAEMEAFKVPGKDYNGFIKEIRKIQIEGDLSGVFANMIIPILEIVLSLEQKKRPTFEELAKFFGTSSTEKVSNGIPKNLYDDIVREKGILIAINRNR